MKKFLSIDGWNTAALHTGDRVICLVGSKGHKKLRTGVVGLGYNYPDEEEKRRIIREKNEDGHYGSWYVIDDVTGKKLYPFTQETILLSRDINVKHLDSTIIEID